MYEEKLATLDVCLHTLNSIQRKWVYLEPIFERGALPQEQRRFKGVDDEFRGIMLSVGDDPRVFSLLRVPQLAENLEAILDQLERCQKALAEFLEEKRDAFSRLFADEVFDEFLFSTCDADGEGGDHIVNFGNAAFLGVLVDIQRFPA